MRKERAQECNKILTDYIQQMILVIKQCFIKLKGSGYTWYKFRHFLQGKQLLWLPLCVPAHESPFEKDSRVKEKNLFPLEANSFLLEWLHFRKRTKSVYLPESASFSLTLKEKYTPNSFGAILLSPFADKKVSVRHLKPFKNGNYYWRKEVASSLR